MNPRFRIIDTPAGYVGIVCSERGLRRVFLPRRTVAALRREILGDFPDAKEVGRLMTGLAEGLRRYFGGEAVEFDVTLDMSGYGGFDTDVWRACRRLHYGQTGSYKSLAERVGRPGGARAVGLAMSRNPCPIVVPCHRVVKSDGSLGGFSAPGGTTLKQRLLQMEAASQPV